jgi:hypothetical protein
MKTIRNLDRQMKEVEDMKLLVKQLTRIDDDESQSRFKRGVFNFIGIILYRQDFEFRKGKADFLKLSKELTVVKSTLRSINDITGCVRQREGTIKGVGEHGQAR